MSFALALGELVPSLLFRGRNGTSVFSPRTIWAWGAGRRRLIACGCCVGEALWTAPHRPLLGSSGACRLLIEWSIDRVVCSTNPLIFLVGWKFGCVRAQTKLPAVPATSPGIIFFYSFDGWWEFFTRASIDLGIYCFKIQVISSAISLANITQVLKSLEKIKNW